MVFMSTQKLRLKWMRLLYSLRPKAIGSGILAISRVLNDLKPDMMVVYADRFEGFAAVTAASQMNIPTAHTSRGGFNRGGVG